MFTHVKRAINDPDIFNSRLLLNFCSLNLTTFCSQTVDIFTDFPCGKCKHKIKMSNRSKGVFIWRRASPLGRANPLCRDPLSQLNSSTKFVFVYMRRGPALLGGISLLTTEISPRRTGNFPYKRTEEGCPPTKRASPPPCKHPLNSYK